MLCSLRNVDACLPITAIQALDSPDARVVLSGQGPYVRLIDDSSGLLLHNFRAFERNNVHGILIKSQVFKQDSGIHAELLIWGGQSFREASVVVKKAHTSVEASVITSSIEYEAPDWILDGAICSDDSASEIPKACLITAHNALLVLDLKPGSCQSDRGTIEWRELATGLRSILYSADVTWLSSEHVLVAAGTAFGEIIVWSCYLTGDSGHLSTENSLSIHYYFTGHEGSIFGVNISPEISQPQDASPRRLLASCSDDRTIRIWDISDCSGSLGKCSVQYNTDGYGLHATGFGETPSDEDSKSCIAQAWGHTSRIWGVDFLRYLHCGDTTSLSLVSHGEDATCQLWLLDLHPDEGRSQEQVDLNRTSSYHYHSGKNIWSLAATRESDHFKIYTGGADGRLVSFCVQDDSRHGSGHGTQTYQSDMNGIFSGNTHDDLSGEVKTYPTPAQLKKKRGKGGGGGGGGGDAVKCYDFVGDDCFLAISARGDARLGHISPISKSLNQNGVSDNAPTIVFEKISTSDEVGGCPITASIAYRGLAVVYGNSHSLQLYDRVRKCMSSAMLLEGAVSGLRLVDLDATELDEPVSNSGPFAILVTYFNTQEVDLILNQGPNLEKPELYSTRLTLPESFKATSFLYIKEVRCTILGFRNGSMVVYRLGKDASPASSVYHGIHGEETVTSIIRVRQPEGQSPNREVILSCGRDKMYSVHILDFGDCVDAPFSFKTVHQSSPPLGTNIEGAHFDANTDHLILHGFRSREFVVWNERLQTEILSVECGGPGRIWAFTPRPSSGGTFIWTQASTFNMYSRESPAHQVLRAGGHGREIKTTAMSNNISAQGQRGRLLATGAEDTTIRLFDIDSKGMTGKWGSFKCLRTLNRHTGGIQHLRWSDCGNFLFSSSGCEEFFVWKIHSIPGFGIGTVFEGSCPKSKEVSDLRVISFDFLEVDSTDDEYCFLFGLAYSNSTVNVFHYSSSNAGGKFTHLASGVYKTNCLTQIQFVKSGQHLSLLTGATDGHAATWALTDALCPFYSVTNGNKLRSQQPSLGIDEISPIEISWQHHHEIHQSSIKSMELAFQSEKEALIITGGDDNALAISRIKLGPLGSSTKSRCSSLLIPKAHASAITAITVIPPSSGIEQQNSKLEFTLASSGNDQRIKLWYVGVDLTRPGVDGIEVVPKADEFSAVADISSMEHFSDGGENETKLLVCGVGIDLWSITE